MTRAKLIVIVSILAVALLTCAQVTQAAEAFLYGRPYTGGLLNLRLYGGGNCTWFVWQCCWQRYGIKLPFVGDARFWVNLAGRQGSTDDKKAWKAVLSDYPEADSIMIMQPEVVGSNYGHVAWVTSCYPYNNFFVVNVLESTMYPPSGWGDAEYQGCRYRRTTYRVRTCDSIKFITFRFGKVVEDNRGRHFIFDEKEKD